MEIKKGDTFRISTTGNGEQCIVSVVEVLQKETEPKIDWSKMPKDTLCEVKDPGNSILHKRYFKEWRDGKAVFYARGASSDTQWDNQEAPWDEYRLIDNPWRPWFGGEMPCCGNVMVEYVLRSGEKYERKACSLGWAHSPHDKYTDRESEIIAYRMLGEQNGD